MENAEAQALSRIRIRPPIKTKRAANCFRETLS